MLTTHIDEIVLMWHFALIIMFLMLSEFSLIYQFKIEHYNPTWMRYALCFVIRGVDNELIAALLMSSDVRTCL